MIGGSGAGPDRQVELRDVEPTAVRRTFALDAAGVALLGHEERPAAAPGVRTDQQSHCSA